MSPTVHAPGTRCIVTLAGGPYAFDVAQAGQIAVLANLTPLPGVPSAIHGLTNLRGRAVAVVDLESALGLARDPVLPAPGCRLLVLDLPRRAAAVPVRSVDGVFAPTAYDPAADTPADRNRDPPWIAAWCPVPGRPGALAAVVDPTALGERLDLLKPRPA